MLLRGVFTGRYAVVDPADGRLRVTAGTPQAAERRQRELLRDGSAEARAADTAAPGDGVHDLRLTLHGAFRLAAFRFDPPADDLHGEAGAL